MAVLPQPINRTDLPEVTQTSALLPEGTYGFKITSVELRTTQKGDGQYFFLQLEITDGQYKGVRKTRNITYINPNPEAQRIGNADLRTILDGNQIDLFSDTDQLIGAYINCKVAKRDTDAYGVQNELKAISKYDPQRWAITESATTPTLSGPQVAVPRAPQGGYTHEIQIPVSAPPVLGYVPPTPQQTGTPPLPQGYTFGEKK